MQILISEINQNIHLIVTVTQMSFSEIATSAGSTLLKKVEKVIWDVSF